MTNRNQQIINAIIEANNAEVAAIEAEVEAIEEAEWQAYSAIEEAEWEAGASARAEAEAYEEEVYRNQLQTFVRLEDLSEEDYATLLEHVIETQGMSVERSEAFIVRQYEGIEVFFERPDFFDTFWVI